MNFGDKHNRTTATTWNIRQIQVIILAKCRWSEEKVACIGRAELGECKNSHLRLQLSLSPLTVANLAPPPATQGVQVGQVAPLSGLQMMPSERV